MVVRSANVRILLDEYKMYYSVVRAFVLFALFSSNLAKSLCIIIKAKR